MVTSTTCSPRTSLSNAFHLSKVPCPSLLLLCHPYAAFAVAPWKALFSALRSVKPRPINSGPGAIKPSESGAQLLSLPPGVIWPQLKAEPLFIRHFYHDCFVGPLESLKPGGQFIIHGNAGSEYLLAVHLGLVGHSLVLVSLLISQSIALKPF